MTSKREWVAGCTEGLALARVGIPQNRTIGLPTTLAPPRNPGTLSSAVPSSLIYSLLYLYVWSRTLGDQRIEGISPGGAFPVPGGYNVPQVPTPASTNVCLRGHWPHRASGAGAWVGGAGTPHLPASPLLLVPPSPFLTVFCTSMPSPCEQRGKEGGHEELLMGGLPQGRPRGLMERAKMERGRAAPLSVGK